MIMKLNKKNLRVLVTGSAGFIGSHVYDLIFDRNYNVFGVDDLSGGFMRNVSKKEYFFKLDLRDRKKTDEFISKLKPQVIFHLAADATEGRSQFTPFSAIDRNINAYINLLVPAIREGLGKMVLISSMSVYGAQQAPFKEEMIPQPEDIYGISKLTMELITKVMSQVYGFKYVIIRPHNVYGPRQNLSDPYRNVIGIFINRLMQGKNFYIYGDGEQRRAFSYIDDVAPLIVELGFRKDAEGEVFNVGSDEVVTLNELSELILKEFFGDNIPAKLRPKYLPYRPQEVKFAFCDHRKIKRMFGFKAKTKIKDGLKKMIDWAKTIGPQEFVYLDRLDLENVKTPGSWKKRII